MFPYIIRDDDRLLLKKKKKRENKIGLPENQFYTQNRITKMLVKSLFLSGFSVILILI